MLLVIAKGEAFSLTLLHVVVLLSYSWAFALGSGAGVGILGSISALVAEL